MLNQGRPNADTSVSLLISTTIVVLSAEQHAKIKNQNWYTRKQKSDVNTGKDDRDLLGDDEESFTGSQADLEGAAEN